MIHAGVAVGGVERDDGVAGRAGEAVGVELGAIDLGVLGERAPRYADRVVATVAVAREGDAARLDRE